MFKVKLLFEPELTWKLNLISLTWFLVPERNDMEICVLLRVHCATVQFALLLCFIA